MRKLSNSIIRTIVIFLILLIISLTFVAFKFVDVNKKAPLLENSQLNTAGNNNDAYNKLYSNTIADNMASKGVTDTNLYYRLCSILEEYFECLSYSNYEAARCLLNKEYQDFININTLDEFIEFAISRKHMDTSFDILKCTEQSRGTYLCEIITFSRNIEGKFANNDEFDDYLDERKNYIYYVVINISDCGSYDISFDGFLGVNECSGVFEDSGIKISLLNSTFLHNRVIYEVNITNNTNKNMDISDKIVNIQALTRAGDTVLSSGIELVRGIYVPPFETTKAWITFDVYSPITELKVNFR